MADMSGFDDWALTYAPTNRRECRDAWAASAKLAEEKFTSTNSEKPPCNMCASEQVQAHNFCSLCGREL